MSDRQLLPQGYEIAEVTREEEFQQAADLWYFAFGIDSLEGKDDLLNYAKNHSTYLYAAFFNNRICATLAVIMFEMRLNGVFVPCAGIASVATNPSHRHRGLVKALMIHALKKMDEAKVPVSSLYPFSFPYYERMGFAVSNMTYKIKAPTSWLRNVAREGKCLNYTFSSLEEHQAAMQIHERSLERWNVTLRRAPDRWQVRLFQFGAKWRMLCHHDGYMLINTKQIKDSEPRTVNIGEWVYLTDEAFIDGLAMLGAMESQADWVQWVDGDIAPLMALGVADPKPTFEVMPTMMSRVLNLQEFEKVAGKTKRPVLDPLGITGKEESSSAGSIGQDSGIGPGALFQQATGFPRATKDKSGARQLLQLPERNQFGAHFCNDFF